MKKITIQDIAKELNLSRNTVAKALNNGVVAYETKITILEKAYEMGYSKLNPELYKLIKPKEEKQQGVIMVLFNRSESLFWNKILTGISDEVRENGYRMQLHIVDENDKDGEETYGMIAPDVKGILFLCGFSKQFVEGINKKKLPMTFFNAPVQEEEYLQYGTIVSLEGKNSIAKIVQDIVDKGKQKFAFIGYAPGSKNLHSRLEGMLLTLEKNGIIPDERMLLTQWKKDGYYNYSVVEEEINALPYIPEVFVCANDDIAKYTATILMKKDMKLAMDTVLVGFDNTIEEEFFKPDIYTVNINKEEVGRRLIKTIVDKIKYPNMDNAIITVATYPILK